MRIDDFDWSRPTERRLLSDAEWAFVGIQKPGSVPAAAREYVAKVRKYRDRFHNPMPISLRKHLLEEFASKGVDFR